MRIMGQRLPYSIDEFRSETTIFYENQGELRIVGANWEFITYLSLANYDERYEKLKLEINNMTNHCDFKLSDFDICTRFDYTLNTMFQEVALQREQMYEAIGRYAEEPLALVRHYPAFRQKRGLINIVGSAWKTLFGVCDDECTKEANAHIERIENSNSRILHLVKNQTTVVKATIQGINSSSGQLDRLYKDLGTKEGKLYEKINEVINNTQTTDTIIIMNQIHSLFVALISQFAYETTTLNAIITAARTGILHPSLVTPRELSKQLTQIKLHLPVNLNLPMGTQANETYELSKITKMAVYFGGSQIVFLLRIPLITEVELTLFNLLPIPLPIVVKNELSLHKNLIIKPEYQYVAISKNRKQYTTFTETQLLKCTETESYTICPEFQPVQQESINQPCEVKLFKNPDTLPDNCEPGVVVIKKNIYHKLKFSNIWLYSTLNDTMTISCSGSNEPYIEKIKGRGLVTLSQNCRAYVDDVILNPTREIESKHYVNFMPKVGVNSVIASLPAAIKP